MMQKMLPALVVAMSAIPTVIAAEASEVDSTAIAACPLIASGIYIFHGAILVDARVRVVDYDGCRWTGAGQYSGVCKPFPDHNWCRYDGVWINTP